MAWRLQATGSPRRHGPVLVRVGVDYMGMSELMATEANSTDHRSRAGEIRDFARSELFERTFQDGMELVEETAAYLDGDGRRESKLLSRAAALAYAADSMRLTTRLMQVAACPSAASKPTPATATCRSP